MSLTEKTRLLQSKLAHYCRTGNEVSLPGITPGRFHQYRRLVYNVIRNTLDKAFPITRTLVHEGDWNDWVHEFFSRHKAKSPLVWQLPRAFYEWSVEQQVGKQLDIPALDDLLLFEWVEIEVHTLPDGVVPKHHKEGNALYDEWVMNPDYRLVPLDYPVHMYAIDEALREKGKWFLLVFREQDTGSVRFLDLAMPYVFLLETIASGKVTAAEAIVSMKKTFYLQEPLGELQDAILQFAEQLQGKGFLLGFRGKVFRQQG